MNLTPATLALLALLAAPARSPKLEQGVRLFGAGDFDGALRVLDALADEATEPSTRERVHLLRGQCFAARQDFGRAEEAFVEALEVNPEATLDPQRVDPAVVQLLESVRTRSTGTLVLQSVPPGADVTIDGRRAGSAPVNVVVSAGRHRLEGGWGGVTGAVDVVVFPKRETKAHWVQVRAPPTSGAFEAPSWRLFLDVKGSFEKVIEANQPDGWGLDFGGGAERGSVRLGGSVRLLPYLAFAPRVGFFISPAERVSVSLEASVPVLFRSPALGLGVAAQLAGEFAITRFLGAYAEVGGRSLLLNGQRGDDTHLTMGLGLRFRGG